MALTRDQQPWDVEAMEFDLKHLVMQRFGIDLDLSHPGDLPPLLTQILARRTHRR